MAEVVDFDGRPAAVAPINARASPDVQRGRKPDPPFERARSGIMRVAGPPRT